MPSSRLYDPERCSEKLAANSGGGDNGHDENNSSSNIELGNKLPQEHNSEGEDQTATPTSTAVGESAHADNVKSKSGEMSVGDSGGEYSSGGGGDVTREDGSKTSVVSTVWIMLDTFESASFFAAVCLSGMGSGVIDTFLFIRCGAVR